MKMLDYYNRARALLEEAGYHEYTTFYFAKDPKYRFEGEMYYFELRGDYVASSAVAANPCSGTGR
jgi:hypothetical protein